MDGESCRRCNKVLNGPQAIAPFADGSQLCSECYHGRLCTWCNKNLDSGRTVMGTPFISGHQLCSDCYENILLVPRIPQLCRFCNGLFTSDDGFLSEIPVEDNDLDGAVLKPDKPTYRANPGKSAEESCPLCRIFILRDPNPDENRHLWGHALYALVRKNFSGLDDGKLRSSGGSRPRDFEGFFFESEKYQYRLTLSVFAREGDPSSNYISQRLPETYLGSDETNQQIQLWLTNCLKSHKECPSSHANSLKIPPRLPTRFINVGSQQDSTVSIVESLKSFHYGEYVALSYCWGREPFLTSTRRNIESFKNGLSISMLPATFKDAVTTTRALGFRYLWIDALCILQDSDDDKAREIGQMGDIYHNATLTIVSVGATKVTDGFLKLKLQLTVTLPYKCPGGEIGSVQVSEQKAVDLHRQTLYTRAWCMQEILLSRRMLIYTDDEVLWQCQTDIKRPNTNHVVYQHDNPTLPSSPFMRLSQDLLSKSTEMQDREFYMKWTAVVQSYTRRQLSVFSDRLPAISGVAARFKTAIPSNAYYAGHWERLFIPLLTWRRSNQRPIPAYIPLTDYRAPSWSWASIEGPVEFEYDPDVGNIRNLHAIFISCTVEHLSQLVPLGEVGSGSAVINASMLRATDVYDRIHGGDTTIFSTKNILNLQYLNQYSDALPGLVLDIPSDLEMASQIRTSSNNMDSLNVEEWEKGWFLLLGERKLGSKNKSTLTQALVLMPVEERKDTFRRIGIFRPDKTGASKEWVKAGDRRTITIV